MGALLTNMQKFLFIAALVLVSASALSTDEPEAMSSTDVIDSFGEATAFIQELQSKGKNDDGCRDLATAAKKEVSDSVNAAQNSINALPDGSACAKEGQGLIDAANKDVNNARNAMNSANSKYSNAQNAKVDFGSIRLDHMTPGRCGTFTGHSAYKTAEANREAAKKAASKAKGAYDAAQKELENAKTAAAKMKKDCQCKSFDDAERAYNAAKAADAANQKAWTKAAHMKCVLDGVSPSNCKVSQCPKVTMRQMASGVSKCSGGGGGGGNVGKCSAAHFKGFGCRARSECPSGGSRITDMNTCKSKFKSYTGVNPTGSSRSQCWSGHPVGCFTHYWTKGGPHPYVLFNTCGKTSGTTYGDTATVCQ